MRAFSNSTVGARGAAVMLAKSVLGGLRGEEGEVEDEDEGLEEEDGREVDEDDAAAALSGDEDGVEKCRCG
jgi:hypothetical protein